MPFTIPSGIITTEVSCLERIANEIPEIGILTTKSIGPDPKIGNREPILGQYAPGCFVNAVGLTNPGAEEFAKELSSANIPQDKFLLASIFGKNTDEFVFVAKTLEEHVDGFELNLSCPHAKDYGMQLGQDAKIVAEITKAVVQTTNKPVFAKLTPNVNNIGEITKSAIAAGANGVIAINTLGPGYYSVDGNAVLTNKVGGLSGRGILPVGLKCVRDIRQAVGGRFLIGVMGGIRTAKDILEYRSVAGEDVFFGIGSGLIGMDDRDLGNYFPTLIRDLENNTNHAEDLLKEVDMEYKKVKIEDKLDVSCDLKVFRTNYSINSKPGQFVFAWIPEVGEKPFSVMDDNPLTLGILDRGEFTQYLNSLQKGDYFYVRGPYGKGANVPQKSNVVLVGGGCGIAGLYLLAKRFSRESNVLTLLAAKDKEHITYLDEFEKYGQVKVSTEDGSLGKKGIVTDLISNLRGGSYFFNCGPEAMVESAIEIESRFTNKNKIYSSVDYMTRCGVGICGSCANEKGKRTCIEGPFINP